MPDSFDLFSQELAGANHILIALPKNPNFDQVAAGLALFLSLQAYGKPTTIACPTQMIVEFNRLVGVDKVARELGNKNLTIKFVNFRPDDIERVRYDIVNGEFLLSVIPKPAAAAPTKEQIEFSYSGAASDLVIPVGVTSKEDLLDARSLFILGTQNIPGTGGQELVLPDASCISEVAARVINRLSLPLDADTAGNLYLGIERGTGMFSSPRVSAETFELLAQLFRAKATGQARQVPLKPTSQQPEEQPPKDWLQPKIYKGNTLP